MLTVCVWRVVHTNRGNSAGRLGPGAGPFGAALKALVQLPPKGVARESRNRQERRGAPGDSMPASRPCSGPMGIP